MTGLRSRTHDDLNTGRNLRTMKICEYRPHATVVHDRANSRGWRSAIHWDINPSRFENAEDSTHRGNALLLNQSDAVAWLQSSRRQKTRDSVGTIIQFPVGHAAAVRINHRNPVAKTLSTRLQVLAQVGSRKRSLSH